MNGFEQAFELVIGAESGYVDDPKDPGGETKFGISKRAYPKEDIKALTLDRARELYKRDYWDKVHGDELPWPLSLFVFDTAVNQGVKSAVVLLQLAVNVADDGIFGPGTLAAAKKAGLEQWSLFMAHRAMRYFKTDHFERFGKGWLKRMFVMAQEAWRR